MITQLLLVEDSLTTQTVVHSAFTPEEAEIIAAHDAATALHILHTVTPDVIIIDAFLPGVDGFQLCQIIRETIGLRHTPVILLTSNFATYDHTRGEQVGVTAHLPKPFEGHEIRQLIQQLVPAPAAAPRPADRVILPPAERSVSTPPQEKPPTFPRAEPDMPAGVPSQTIRSAPADELTAIISQWTPGMSAPTAPAAEALEQVLGRAVLQIVQDTLHTRLTTMVEQLTPQLLTMVQEMVTTRTADLLETLLQREIDKLKRTLEEDAADPVQDR